MSEQSQNQSLISQLEDDYYLGGYQSCINKASSIPKCREATFYMCLSYFHLGKLDILKLETSKSDDICVKLIDKLVSFTQNPDRRDVIIGELKSKLENKEVDSKDELSSLVISSIFVKAKLFEDALRSLDGLNSLPISLARVSTYYQMNRADFAEKEISKMMKVNKYNTLTLLAAVPTDTGDNIGEKWLEPDLGKASELEGIYKPTALIKNLQTVAAISMGNHDLAKEHCQNALDMDNDNVEALINMQHILSKTRASASIKERYTSRLKSIYPDHEFVKEFDRIDAELI